MPFEPNRRKFIQISAAGAALFTMPTGGALAQTNLGKVEYGVASIDAINSVAYATLKKGFFKQHGLEVNYLNSQSGSRSKQMLAAGQLFVTTSGASDPIGLTLAGKPAKLIFGLDQRIPYANILIRGEDHRSGRIKSLKDLAGKTIAVPQLQSATWLMATYIADQNGILDQIDIRGLGDLSTMLGALKSGKVDASIATISMIDAAIQAGWGHTLFDVTEEAIWNDVFGGDIPGLGCYVLSETLEKRRDAVQAFVSAMSQGQKVLNDSTPEEIADMIFDEYLTGHDRAAVLRALNVYKSGVWSKSNEISSDAYGRLINIMGNGRQFKNEELAGVPYEKLVDMSFLKKA